jgi:hypothetical protein
MCRPNSGFRRFQGIDRQQYAESSNSPPQFPSEMGRVKVVGRAQAAGVDVVAIAAEVVGEEAGEDGDIGVIQGDVEDLVYFQDANAGEVVVKDLGEIEGDIARSSEPILLAAKPGEGAGDCVGVLKLALDRARTKAVVAADHVAPP